MLLMYFYVVVSFCNFLMEFIEFLVWKFMIINIFFLMFVFLIVYNCIEYVFDFCYCRDCYLFFVFVLFFFRVVQYVGKIFEDFGILKIEQLVLVVRIRGLKQ